MTDTLLIGLVGKAGAGKDTAAFHLYYEHDFHREAWAGPVYAMVDALLMQAGVTPRWEDREWKEACNDDLQGFSPRRLLQSVGTEWGREHAPGLWHRIMETKWNNIDGRLPGFVISDTRFADEADWILERGGHLVEILRPSAAPVAAHASEQTEWTVLGYRSHRNWHTLHNMTSVRALFDQVDALVGRLRRPHG